MKMKSGPEQAAAAILIKDIMTKEVIFANPETPIAEVAKLMFEKRIHGVPVIDDDQKIVGIVTETDFFTKDAALIYLPSYISFLKGSLPPDNLSPEKKRELDELLNVKAKDIMTAECVTILQEMQVKGLLEFFKTTGFMTLPVTDESNRMVGIVTLADVLGLLRA